MLILKETRIYRILSQGTMKPLGAKWLVKIFVHLKSQPDIIKNGIVNLK